MAIGARLSASLLVSWVQLWPVGPKAAKPRGLDRPLGPSTRRPLDRFDTQGWAWPVRQAARMLRPQATDSK